MGFKPRLPRSLDQHRRTLLYFVLALPLACSVPACAGAEPGNSSQMDEARVTEYLAAHPEFLLEHPEIVRRALALEQDARDRSEAARRQRLIEAEAGLLFDSDLTPVQGDEEASYTLIEFSDYQCEPCRLSFPVIESFARTTPGVRLVRLQLPIYGPHSTLAARAALLAEQRGDFETFHEAMMAAPGPVDRAAIATALEAAGVPEAELAARMNDPEFSAYLERVRDFSIAAGVVGTPAYLLNGILLTGALTEHDLHTAIAKLQQQGD